MSEIDYNQAVQVAKNAVERAGRQKVEALLGRYDAGTVRELRYCDAEKFIREARELQPDPPPLPDPRYARDLRTTLAVKFAIGDRVCNHDARACVKGVVTGYEIRYIVQEDGHGPPGFARRGEKLKHARMLAPPAPPAPVGIGRAWSVGSAIDDMKRATLGQSFTTDGTELIASLRTYGLYIVEGPL